MESDTPLLKMTPRRQGHNWWGNSGLCLVKCSPPPAPICI